MNSATSTPLLPVIRPLSRPVSRLLVKLPFTANQVTAASLVFGLACNWALTLGTWEWAVFGGVMMVLCYLFDNSDGDVARAKNQCSEFGRRFDSFVDWIVHASFFPCLGIGWAGVTGNDLWLWLGWIACAGGTVNYAVGFLVEAREKRQKGDEARTGHEAPEESRRPRTAGEWAVFIFRELFRADFCFIVLALALADGLWLLLPAGAIGSQVYWLAQFAKGANEFHV
ncbi:MAG: CDP-alcohol phosphatidyltransferase family protein [Magnetospirillum sp. WYHS-4]